MRKSIRQIFLTAHYQYIEWILNGKQIIVFIILFFMMKYVTDPLAALSIQTDIPLQWTEAFLATVNSVYTLPIILFCFMTLMSEFPKRDHTNINLLFYTNRKSWFYGQVLLAVYTVITFLAEILTCFLIRTAPIVYIENGWSPIIHHYAERYMEIGRSCGIIAVVPAEVYNHFTPDTALFYTLLLFFGMLLEMSLILLVFDLLGEKIIGVLSNLILSVLGVVIIYLKSEYVQFLPLGNAVLKCQNMPVTKLTDWYMPVLYFLFYNTVLIIIGKRSMKKVQL